MDKKDEAKFVSLITDALNDVVIPAMEEMEKRLASKEDLEKVRIDLSTRIDSIDRKFDSQQSRLDRHEVRISNLEKSALQAL